MLDDVDRPARIEPGPGQESVWDYPRPPRVEPSSEHVVVRLDDTVIADTRRAWRVLETSQAPAYYLPPEDVRMDLLQPAAGTSWCEWKGLADYLDVVVGTRIVARAAWRYRDPTPSFRAITDHLAFYPALLACAVDGAAVQPMPGGFYGGWITPRVVGPFKGAPGTRHW
jgi:uncharacterized protein (DUF427 family)